MVRTAVQVATVAVVLITHQIGIAAQPFQLTVKRTYSPNLLTNPGFEKIGKNRMPEGWSFDNCCKSEYLQPSIAPGCNGRYAAKISIADRDNEELYGYWLQAMRNLPGGRKYYLAMNLKVKDFNGSFWLALDYPGKKPDWHGVKPCFNAPNDTSGDLLLKFVNPAYVMAIPRDTWTVVEREFDVPEGPVENIAALRCFGAYSATQGEVAIDDVFFADATNRVDVEIAGLNLKKISIAPNTGKAIAEKVLDPKLENQSWSFSLPSRKVGYTFDVEDAKGNHYKVTLENEIPRTVAQRTPSPKAQKQERNIKASNKLWAFKLPLQKSVYPQTGKPQKCDQIQLVPNGTLLMRMFEGSRKTALTGEVRRNPESGEWEWLLSNGVSCRILHKKDTGEYKLVFSVKEQEKKPRLIRVELEKTAVMSDGAFWDGFEERKLSEGVTLKRNKLMDTFPLACVYDSRNGVALGISADSVTGNITSKTLLADGKVVLRYGSKVVVDNRRDQELGFVAFEFNPEFGWKNAVQDYYAMYPKQFLPTEGVDERIYGVGGYIALSSGYSGYELHPRRFDRMSWEWTYAPWVMAGEWFPEEQDNNESIYGPELVNRGILGTFKPAGQPVSWKEYQDIYKEYFASSSRAVAPLFYILVKGVNNKLIGKFPDSQFRDADGRLMGSSVGDSVKPDFGNTGIVFAYGTGLQQYLERKIRLAVENYDISGFSFDMANYGLNNYGPAQMNYGVARCFDEKGRVFTGDYALPIFFADYIHGLKRDGKTMAVYMNLAWSGAVAFTAFHADGVMFEGCPSNGASQIALERLMCGKKPMTLWGGVGNGLSSPFIDREGLKHSPGLVRTVTGQLAQLALQYSLKYGLSAQTWASLHPTIRPWLDVVLAIQKAGWNPVPAIKGPGSEKLWIGRFGEGAETIITISNPERETIKAELELINSYLGKGRYLLVAESGTVLKQRIISGRTQFHLELPPKGIAILRAVEVAGCEIGEFVSKRTSSGNLEIEIKSAGQKSLNLRGRFRDFSNCLMAAATADEKPLNLIRDRSLFSLDVPTGNCKVVILSSPVTVLANTKKEAAACFSYQSIRNPETRPVLVLPETATREEQIASDMFELYYPANVSSLRKIGKRNVVMDAWWYIPSLLKEWPFQRMNLEDAKKHDGWKVCIGRISEFPELNRKLSQDEKERLRQQSDGIIKVFPESRILLIGGTTPAAVREAANRYFDILDQTELKE